MMETDETTPAAITPFFERPQVERVNLPVGQGVPFGLERVEHPEVGLAGVYGTWGECYDNQALIKFVESRLGEPLDARDQMNLAELGFIYRHHTPRLAPEEHNRLETEVGARILRAAAEVNGWDPAEVDAVLIGISSPISGDYLERISQAAGIPADALKVSIHKACDGSVGALHLALNPHLSEVEDLPRNLAAELEGKKVLVGGIEGLSRLVQGSRDKNALQLFGNAAGVIGVVPEENLKFVVGKTHEVFDDEGVLQVRMAYPYRGTNTTTGSRVEWQDTGVHSIRLAGMMHEPQEASTVVMAGPMGMVKLFVRTGVQVVREVFGMYQAYEQRLGEMQKALKVAIVHHANFKINKLKEKNLQKEGIVIPMPWLLSEFGNVSAASNMIAFLRKLPDLLPGDNVLIDGFGAGTYYDALVVEMGG